MDFNRIDEKYERPLIKCGITSKSEKEFGQHPTQKPIYVMKWCIERLSNAGDIILDPFMGSGSTGIACLETGRRFIGIELDERYYKLAVNRINGYIYEEGEEQCKIN
ncbi:site-specific DNA-methyltransferase [Clostridium baratii]